MFPDKLYDNFEKTNWSHADCFGEKPFEYTKAFVHKNYTYGMHTHNFYEVNIVLKGTGRHYIENQSCAIKRGCVFIIPPNVRHGYMQGDPLDVYHILISLAFMERYASELRYLPGYQILFEIEPNLRTEYDDSLFLRLEEEQMCELERILNELLSLLQVKYEGCEVMMNAQALYIIGLLCEHTFRRNTESRFCKLKNRASHSVLSCLEYIYLRYQEKITVELLAEYCNMSRSTLLRNFQLICKCSPIEYLNKYRIQKAKELMTSTIWNMTKIALECGFYDQSHFTKAFIKVENLTPIQFKKMI